MDLDNSDNLDNLTKYTLADARRLWMTWWNRNAPDFLNLRAKHHAEGQRAFQSLIAEDRADLRTDEAVERVARSIARLNPGEAWPDETIIDDEYRDECFETARDAITALLGTGDSNV